MKPNKAMIGIISLLIMSIIIIAEEPSDFIENINGYVRVGYQENDHKHTNIALGGKVHIKTSSWNNFSVGTSIYTSDALISHKGASISFFDASNHSYTILGEAYIEGKWGNTSIKIGRQSIETPFADSDDIGMIPNTFEAAVLINHDLKDTTIFLGQLQKYAGVDSNTPSNFTQLNKNKGVQVLGFSYNGIKNIFLSAWLYRLKDNVTIAYFDASYKQENDLFMMAFNVQYSQQKYEDNRESIVYGAESIFDFKPLGLSASIAYNTVNGVAAENFFGGGPYFTNAQHHTLTDALNDGESFLYGFTWNATHMGIDTLSFTTHIHSFMHENKKSKEYDFTVNYRYTDTLNFAAIYSDIEDATEPFSTMRIFVNYMF